MEETLKYLTKRVNFLEEQNNSIISHNIKLRSEVEELKENFKEIKRLIDKDYFEDGSFENYYKVLELLEECLKGEDNE